MGVSGQYAQCMSKRGLSLIFSFCSVFGVLSVGRRGLRGGVTYHNVVRGRFSVTFIREWGGESGAGRRTLRGHVTYFYVVCDLFNVPCVRAWPCG